MKQTLLKTLALGLLTVWSSQTWAGDFIDDAATIQVAGTITYAKDDSGKKILDFTSAEEKSDVELLFTFDGKEIKPGQIFGVIEYAAGGDTYNKCRMMKLTLGGSDFEEKSAGSTMYFSVGDNTVVLCSFLQNPNDDAAKSLRKYFTDNVDKPSFTLTGARVFAGVTANSAVTIRRVGIYTLGEILELYPSLKTKNWQINDSYRLLNDGTNNANNSSTNNGNDNGWIETKNNGSDITTVAGCKLWVKAVDPAKLPANYNYIYARRLNPTDATTEDIFSALKDNQVLMLSFGTGSNAHVMTKIPTMHKKLIDFDRKMYNYTFVDGVNPTQCAKVDVKGSQSTNYATYSRVLKAGYNSCAMPFKKIANASDVPAGISFYKVGALTDGKITFTKIADPTASNTFTDGTNWTPVIIHAETAGVYTFVGRDGIADLSGYKAKTVGNSGNQLKWVGSFVEEKPTGDYLSTINYGITSNGSSFAKFGTDTKTSYYRAFLADGRGATARELSLSFDDDVTSISEELRVKNEELTSTAGYFNLAGQRVAQPTRGLYIVNGKKVVIK